MNELKPDMIYHGRCIWDCGNGGHHDTEMLTILAKGTKLYAAPDTHRVMSVEHISRIKELLQEVAMGHATPSDAEYNQCDSAPCNWCAAAVGIIAIIDSKVTT